MYNRYTPRQDGGYRHDRVPEASRPQQTSPSSQPPCKPEASNHTPPPEPCREPPEHPHPSSATSFLSSLLPRNMDTGDLLMLLILLLLITDGSDDAPNPLLTIALFFLME